MTLDVEEFCLLHSHFTAGIEMKSTEPVSVFKLFSRCPALVAAHGILSSSCNALPCVLSLMKEMCAQQYPCLEPVDCRLKTKGGLQFYGYLFSPGSEIFLLQEISKNTAPHLPW